MSRTVDDGVARSQIQNEYEEKLQKLEDSKRAIIASQRLVEAELQEKKQQVVDYEK